jgi:DNA polymerase III epsilon subunit family exonuclease
MKAADVSTFPRIVRENRFCVIDLEATGLGRNDEIIQVALVQVDRGQVRLRVASYVRPVRASIAEDAYAKHGLGFEVLQHAPTLAEIADDILHVVGGRTLLGFNAARFDYPLLQRSLQGLGKPFDRGVLDVLKWERRLFSEKGAKHNLAVVAERYGITQRAHHDALDDCRVTWNVFLKLAEQHEALGNLELREALDVHETPPLPEGLLL